MNDQKKLMIKNANRFAAKNQDDSKMNELVDEAMKKKIAIEQK